MRVILYQGNIQKVEVSQRTEEVVSFHGTQCVQVDLVAQINPIEILSV